MATHQPSVSIVIPAYNEERAIRRCVLSALEQSVPAHEIIVVDNRSTDATCEIVEALQRDFPDGNIRLLHQSQIQGLIPTRNFGFEHATGDVIGRIDADSLIGSDWVETVRSVFADSEVMAATGPVTYHDMPLKKFGLQADDALRQLVSRLGGNYQFLFGSNMAIRRSAWAEIASEVCRDEADLMHEDIDLSIHLTKHELKVVYASSMIGGMSARRLRDSPKDYRHYVMRFERTYAHHGIMNPALRVPIAVYLAIYYPLRVVQALYDRDGESARVTAPK